uniref:Nucleolar protein 9 n=1 Tax=Clastoptera arizonana TaxID=38151 RepID=A0A1B6DSA6_9HEMI
MEGSENNEQKFKRKRKKSFGRIVKKMRGDFKKLSRGVHIEEDTFNYFVRVLQLENQEFDSLDDKINFANNVLEQTVEHEVQYCSNQLVSRVLEKVLPLGHEGAISRFLEAFCKDLRIVCVDKYASHIIEALLLLTSKVLYKTEDKTKMFIKPEKDTYAYNCFCFIIKVAKFMLNNLEEFVPSISGNHILRTLFFCLTGSIVENNNVKIDKEKLDTILLKDKIERYLVPNDFMELFQEFINRLTLWPQFSDLAFDSLTSALLQSLLRNLNTVDSQQCNKIIKKLLKKVYFKENLNDFILLLENNPSVHLLECMIELVNDKLYSTLYEKCFSDNLPKLSKKENINFTVQKLINNCNSKEHLEKIVEQLSPILFKVLQHRKTGVILSLCQACERVGTKQADFIKALETTLNVNSEEKQDQLALHTVKMVPYDGNTDVSKLPCNLHGSLILQSMLRFKKPIKVVKSLLSINSSELAEIFCDIKGSHIGDTFLTAEFIGEKSRDKLLFHLVGTYAKLATSKSGSRFFDNIWKIAPPKFKIKITEELSGSQEIYSSPFGKFITNSIGLSSFKHNREEWKKALILKDKPKKLFADIIGNLPVK